MKINKSSGVIREFHLIKPVRTLDNCSLLFSLFIYTAPFKEYEVVIEAKTENGGIGEKETKEFKTLAAGKIHNS